MINCAEFKSAMRAHGMEPPYGMAAGVLHRFPGIDKQSNNRAGWCILFEDCEGGCFGDWSTGLRETWRSNKAKKLSGSEREKFAKQVREARLKAEESKRQKEAIAAIEARVLYGAAAKAPAKFPYLIAKQVQPHSARLVGDRLALPIQDFFGNLTSLQFIAANGEKRMVTGGRKEGCFIAINKGPEAPERVIICEGWATGATLAEEFPDSKVIAAIDAGNLKSVARGADLAWPDAELIVAGDDDRSKPENIGAEKAREAAKAVGAMLVFPQWPVGAPLELSDFNDLAVYLKRGAA